MRPSFLFLLLLTAFTATGCTEAKLVSHMAKKLPGGQAQSEGNFKVGSPYKVNGKWYHPQEDYSFSETGIASWYGPQFHGKRTANGEVFDMNELTAAHKTLQLPSLVRVTNLENGRSMVVRVNDRGPFKRGRIIDLSKRAAELLGFKGKGVAKVKIRVLAEESRAIALAAKHGEDTRGIEVAMNERRDSKQDGRPEPLVPAPESGTSGYQTVSTGSGSSIKPVERTELSEPEIRGHTQNGRFYPDPVVNRVPVAQTNIFVQVGSFSMQDNAIRLAQKLQTVGNAQVYPAMVNGRQFFRVRIPSADVAQADIILSRLAAAGNGEAIIVVE